ncbi:hypothetical protein E3N88_29474 [Mikania micrantha]|uniref:Uncharacterized protein n=1 Tax=Mikania micrantha TaxID=192012 RepID=A0A5N6MIW8_9ASTR|nr:hypothetical protein E3N88_29474 [Mikania micrantha]
MFATQMACRGAVSIVRTGWGFVGNSIEEANRKGVRSKLLGRELLGRELLATMWPWAAGSGSVGSKNQPRTPRSEGCVGVEVGVKFPQYHRHFPLKLKGYIVGMAVRKVACGCVGWAAKEWGDDSCHSCMVKLKWFNFMRLMVPRFLGKGNTILKVGCDVVPCCCRR